MNCVNCGECIEQGELKLFAGVGVCPECHQVAELIMQRGQTELRNLTALMKEVVRTSLVEGTLSLPREVAAPADRMEVLGMIITMKEAHRRREANRNAGQVRARVH